MTTNTKTKTDPTTTDPTKTNPKMTDPIIPMKMDSAKTDPMMGVCRRLKISMADDNLHMFLIPVSHIQHADLSRTIWSINFILIHTLFSFNANVLYKVC